MAPSIWLGTTSKDIWEMSQYANSPQTQSPAPSGPWIASLNRTILIWKWLNRDFTCWASINHPRGSTSMPLTTNSRNLDWSSRRLKKQATCSTYNQGTQVPVIFKFRYNYLREITLWAAWLHGTASKSMSALFRAMGPAMSIFQLQKTS